MRIYTRTGDTGFSSTGNRRMIPKNSPVFSLLGALEELDASLGEAAGKLPAGLAEVAGTLRRDVAALSAELSGGEKLPTPPASGEWRNPSTWMMESAARRAGRLPGERGRRGARGFPGNRAPGGAGDGLRQADGRRHARRDALPQPAFPTCSTRWPAWPTRRGPGPAAPPADFGGGFLERALELWRRVLAAGAGGKACG